MTEVLSVAEYRAQRKKPPKYRNTRVKFDGYSFDSLKEKRRYEELKLMLHAGDIWDLKVHPRFEFRHNQVWIGAYRADFSYKLRQSFTDTVEDVKSVATKRARDWPLRRQLMKAFYGIEVIEV